MIALLLVITFAMSFLFAGSEIGFTSLNRMLVDVWVKNDRIGGRLTRWFVVNPENFLSTTLVGNSIAITTFTTLAVYHFVGFGYSEVEIYIAVSLLIILFSEILPKVIFQQYHNYLFPGASLPVGLFFLLFLPVVLLARAVSVLLAHLVEGSGRVEMATYYRNAFKAMFHFQFDEKLLDEEAVEYIRNVVALSEHTAREVLTPRVDLIALAENMTLAEAIPVVQESGFSKFPVFQEDVDHITGYVVARDFFKRPATLKEIVRPVRFFPETVSTQALLKAFDEQHLSLAIILDEYGGTAGLITHEDLAEELFGEISDEHDPEVVWIRPLSSGRWLVNTRMELEDFFTALEQPEPEGAWETVGGWIIDRHGGIPAVREKVAIDDWRFTVVRATKRRLGTVILENPPSTVPDPEDDNHNDQQT